MQKITPFLWFNDNAEEAMNFYISIFNNPKFSKGESRITNVSRYSDAGPGPAGSVMVGSFKLDGQMFIALNGGPQYKFTEAVSFVVGCDTQEEIDYYWNKLTEGGKEVQCGWLKDKFGLSWQITPNIMGELMSSGDPEKSKRVMQAMYKMVKIDIEGLKNA